MKEEPHSKADQQPFDVRRYRLGVFIGFLCAASGVAASMIVIFGQGYDAILAMLIGIYVCLPLLVLLFVAWLVYTIRDRGYMPARAHAWLWLPTVAAALVLPAAATMDDWRKSRQNTSFPPASELHVNLTGQDLWIPTRHTSSSSGPAPNMPMPAGQPGSFVPLTRWPGAIEPLPGPLFPYGKGLLLPEFDRLPRQLGAGPEAGQPWPQDEQAYASWTLSYPEPSVQELKRHRSFPGDGSMLEYVYYHYPDRIEIAPVIQDSFDLQELPADALQVPLVGFQAMNMTNEEIVRLEVNGQAVRIGAWGKAVAPMLDCNRGHTRLGVVQMSLDDPLQIRWQTGRAPHEWREATVSLPALEGELPAGSEPRRQQVLLYFDENDQVLAERFQEVRFADHDRFEGSIGLRLTGVPEGLSRTPPCQSALDSYDRSRVFVLPPQ